MKTRHLFILPCLAIVLSSCEKEKLSDKDSIGYHEHGIFVVNEGAYGNNNGSVSYLPNAERGVIADAFRLMNGVGLGDVVQSMNIYNGRGYMVVNNSQKVEVVNMTDFKSSGTIIGFSGPRYFLPINSGKAYVSDWFSNQVKVIDLNTLSITSAINVGSGPEQMAMSNNKVYVTNIGGFGNDSTVSVIDIASNTVIKTIKVGLNPNSIISLQTGELLVLCGGTTGPDYTGGTADDIGGEILQISPATDSVTWTLSFPQSFHPLKLIANNAMGKIYFLGGSDGYTGMVDELHSDLNIVTPLIPGNFYGLGVNPANGNIYCGRPGFSAKDYFLRFKPDGILIDSNLAGIGPNGFVFN